jgi:phosphoribosylanthranilate isomerase
MRTRVKVCGLTRVEDVRLAARLGADAVGFVFVPGGPRAVTPLQARELAAAAGPYVSRVGVFGPDQRREAPAWAEACRLDTLQILGPPDPAYCAYYRGRFAIVAAIGVPPKAEGAGAPDLDALATTIADLAPHVDGILLDTAKAGMLGGTGQAFDWSVLEGMESRVPLVVAGGLTPANVGELVRLARPWGVDVSSGVEAAPGEKDPASVAAFLAAVGQAASA